MPVVSSTLQIDLVDDVSKNAKQVAAALEAAQKQTLALEAALAKSGASDRLQGSLKKIGASAEHVKGVTLAWKDYEKAQGLAGKATSEWTREQSAAVRSWEGITLSAVRAVKSEEASLARARSEQASRAVRDAERAAHARNEQIRRGGLTHMVAGAAAGAVTAHGVVRASEISLEKGAELQHTRMTMLNAGIDADTRRQIENQSLSLSASLGNVSQTAIMELAKEARSVLQDVHELPQTTEVLAKAKAVLDANDRTGGSSQGLGMLVRGAESIGAAKDPERFAKLIDAYVKAIQVMGKTINPEQIYEFDKYLKAGGARISDRFLMTTGLSLAQEMGGSTAGNDIAQVAKAITSGFPNKHGALKELANVGLIARNDIEWLHTGEAKRLKTGRSVKGANLAASDLDLWVYKNLLPSLERKGIRKETDQLNWINRVFTGTQADVIAKLITQRASFENHAVMYGQATGLGATANNRWEAAAGLVAFTTALGNLEGNATSPVMAAAGRGLYGLADAINWLALQAKKHPTGAVLGAAGVAAGGLAASGYLGYKIMNGFGLGTSAKLLDGSAAALTEAAIKLGGGSALTDGAKVLGGAATAGAGAAAAIAAGAIGSAIAADAVTPNKDKPALQNFWDDDANGVASGGLFHRNSYRSEGGGDGRAMPIRFADDSTSLTTFERAVSRGVGDGMMAFAGRYGSSEGGGPGGGGIIKASYGGGGGGGGDEEGGAAGRGLGGMRGGGGIRHGGAGVDGRVQGRRALGAGGGRGGRGRAGGEDAGTKYSDPNDFYDAIIKAEGTGKHGSAYETSLGYTKSPKPLTQMTMNEVLAWGDHVRKETAIGRKTNSSAKGAFQIVNTTQREAMKALGIRGDEIFSEENQRRMASWIARRQGLGAWEGLKINPTQMARARQALKAGRDRDVHYAKPEPPKAAPPIAQQQDDPLGLRRRRQQAPAVDTETIRASLDGLDGAAVSPDFDHDGIDKYTHKIRTARAELEALHGAQPGGGSSGRIAGLGSRLRGGFAHAGSDFG